MPAACLDTLDPPAWDPAPAHTTYLIRRCHELRRKPLDRFTVEDLRLMIGQQIGLTHLVPPALQRLREDPLTEGDFYRGDLLASVLRIDAQFWKEHPLLADALTSILNDARIQPAAMVEPTLNNLIASFYRAHPA